MQQTKFSFSTFGLFSEAWAIFKQRPWFFIIFTIIYGLLGNISFFSERMGDTDGGVPVSPQLGGFIFLMALISFILSILIGAGVMKTFIRVAKGEVMNVNFSDLFSVLDFKILLHYVLASIVTGILVIVGLILLIIPGFYFMFKYCFTLYIVIDKGVSFSKAMDLSGIMTKGIKFDLLGFYLISLLIALGGLIALGVGILVAIPIIYIATSLVYVRAMKFYEEASLASSSAEPVGVIQN